MNEEEKNNKVIMNQELEEKIDLLKHGFYGEAIAEREELRQYLKQKLEEVEHMQKKIDGDVGIPQRVKKEETQWIGGNMVEPVIENGELKEVKIKSQELKNMINGDTYKAKTEANKTSWYEIFKGWLAMTSFLVFVVGVWSYGAWNIIKLVIG